jgi:tripartite motif-containing protein 71
LLLFYLSLAVKRLFMNIFDSSCIFGQKQSNRFRYGIFLVTVLVLFATLFQGFLITPIYANSAIGFLLKWGQNGAGAGEFKGPGGMAIDASGNVYVADYGNYRVQKFDSSGTLLGWWGQGTSTTGWHAPGSPETGVAGTGDGEFNGPGGIAVDASGIVYVSDDGNNRIQKFNSSGTLLGWWGQGTSTNGWHLPGSGETGVTGTGDGQFDFPWGVAVDDSGNVYVSDVSNHRIQKFTGGGVFLGWLGCGSSTTGWHASPSGETGVSGSGAGGLLGWLGRGNSTTGWHNPGSGEYGVTGGGDGQFDQPIDVSVDSSGNVYVSDEGNHRIQKFTGAGGLLGWLGRGNSTTGWHNPGSGEIGVLGIGNGQFNQPSSMAVETSGNLYVVDGQNDRIQKFGEPQVVFLGWFGRGNTTTGWHNPYSGQSGVTGDGDSQFHQPDDVAVDASGNVYVADTGNHRVQKFDTSGTFLGWWGKGSLTTGWHASPSGETGGFVGTGDGEFNQPYNVAVDGSGNLYVADGLNNRIQKFDSSGIFLGWWGKGIVTTGWHLPSSGETGVSGSGDGEFNGPGAVAVDSAGNVYVSDDGNYRIQKFNSSGTLLGWWGQGTSTNGWHAPGSLETGVTGTGDGQFDFPWGMAVDASGNVYVSDVSNHRIQKFTGGGVFLGWLGSGSSTTGWHAPGSAETGVTDNGDSQFNQPYGVAVDASGSIYVADTYNMRIQKFGQAELSITKTDNSDPITAGDNLTYTITVTNNGLLDATGVSVIDSIPIGTTYSSNAASQGSYSSGVWSVGNLTNGTTATLTLIVNVNSDTTGIISNTATVTGDQTDSNSTNNSAAEDTTVSDSAHPTAAITYSVAGPYKSGTVVTITAIFDEVMADSPVVQLAISGSNTVAATNMVKTDSTHYYYGYTVGAGNGTATVALSTSTDLALNVITSAPTSGATFDVDNTARPMGVGGEVATVRKMAVITPWLIGLILISALMISGTILVLRRRKRN